jgi:hypothetical protein
MSIAIQCVGKGWGSMYHKCRLGVGLRYCDTLITSLSEFISVFKQPTLSVVFVPSPPLSPPHVCFFILRSFAVLQAGVVLLWYIPRPVKDCVKSWKKLCVQTVVKPSILGSYHTCSSCNSANYRTVVWMDTCRWPMCWLAVSPSTSIKHDDVILLPVDHRCKGWRPLVHLVVVSISQGVNHSLRYRRLRHIIICLSQLSMFS